jgi:predicted nucleic acid-binding protein
MIYLDSSVALAHLFREPRRPPDAFWGESLCSSRLLKYELWNRMHAHGESASRMAAASYLVSGMLLVEMVPEVLERALDPFPVPLRTLDALHLATMHFLREQGREVVLASYDDRFTAAARALDFDIAPL